MLLARRAADHDAIGFCCVIRCAHRYVAAFQAGFDEGLDKVQLLFMQSDGGLAPVGAFSGHKAVLSGPAGEEQ